MKKNTMNTCVFNIRNNYRKNKINKSKNGRDMECTETHVFIIVAEIKS